MYCIADDPIISCMERTGFPPWIQDEDYSDYEEELKAARDKAFDLLCRAEDCDKISDEDYAGLQAMFDDACTVGEYYDTIDAISNALA